MADESLESIALALVAPGEGILAADESTGTIEKRLKSIDVESTEDKRRDYRDMLLTTPGLGDHISGVILYDETIRQTGRDGDPFTKVLQDAGVIPGIKVDTGAKPLAGAEGETITEGLDGLRERLAGYSELGAKFTKWRAVIAIDGEKIPSAYCIHVNAHALGRYAALSQEAGLVPIVEPEVLMDGGHTLERCYEVTEATLQAVFNELFSQRIVFEGMLLKPNMVISGKDCPQQASPEEVARATIKCFRTVVPAAVPGIVFLSGGQGDEEASANLNAINALGPQPWRLSFSYGRALQAPSLKAWKGEDANIQAGQDALAHRARMNGAATEGTYTAELEKVPTSV